MTDRPGRDDPGERPGDDARRLVASLAHFIRSPLSTIKSGVQLVQLRTAPGDENAPFLEAMLCEVSRIDDALRAAQDYAELEVGPAAPIAAGQLVDLALQAPRGAVGASAAPVVVAPGPPCSVLGDAERLASALAELIVNAARVSPLGGAVTVGWNPPAAGFVSVHVDDDGPGVTEANTARILKPFFSATDRVGLGLNTVQKICLLSGGRLEWRNRPGAGCRFTMILRGE